MNYILTALVVLGVIALIAAIVLYVCSKRFAVDEDPRIGEVAALLPQANCGGCGYAGCSGMAGALVKAADGGSLEGLSCPVGGSETMQKIASVLGMTVEAGVPRIAVVRCQGDCSKRSQIAAYDGLRTCRAMNACGMGETACGYGCLGCGDCAEACSFGGIKINQNTMLPEVDPALCTACGACAKACPRGIIELRPRGPKDRRLYVGCVNKDRGPAAVKACGASCIGCGKCVKECGFEAISVENNVAYIDPSKCRMCRKCEKACPRNAIVGVNFPAPKQPAAASASTSTTSTATSASQPAISQNNV